MPVVINNESHVMQNSMKKNSNVSLQTVTAVLENNTECIIRCLLDGGSETSFICENLSKKLNLPVTGEIDLNIQTFGSSESVTSRRKKVKLKLVNLTNPNKFVIIEAIEYPVISAAEIKMPREDVTKTLNSWGIRLADDMPSHHRLYNANEISLLLGSDVYWKVVTGKIKRISESLVAVETILGWCVQGPISSSNLHSMTVTSNLCIDEELSNSIKSFWEIESLGITPISDENIDEKKALSLFEHSIKMKNGRYEVKLPWKAETIDLRDNFHNAEIRMNKLVKKFNSNPYFFEQYKSVIDEQLREGIIEKIDKNASNPTKTFYVPHRAVIRDGHSSTKLRVVYDASSREKGYESLNDCLLQGPNLVPELLKVLLNFRKGKIAVICDIEKAFLQISIAPEDRDALRFLWIAESSKLPNPQFEVYRMTRVMFGATSSPFLLAATIRHHLKKFETIYPFTTKLLNSSMYVDDFDFSTDSEEEALQVYQEANLIFKQASMNLAKWCSNSKVFNDEIQSVGSKEVKVLGLKWNLSSDCFKFKTQDIFYFVVSNPRIKRTLLQATSRIFDPFGWLSLCVIQVKIMFQKLWLLKIEWDEALPPEIEASWQKWYQQLQFLEQIEVPRWLFRMFNTVYEELHCFCDASKNAYGAIIYFISANSVSRSSQLVMAKSRVAPLKQLSLPKLELMAAVIGTRMIASIRDQFPEARIFMWTDSTITLHWIRGSPRKWKRFVCNRVTEIQTKSDPNH